MVYITAPLLFILEKLKVLKDFKISLSLPVVLRSHLSFDRVASTTVIFSFCAIDRLFRFFSFSFNSGSKSESDLRSKCYSSSYLKHIVLIRNWLFNRLLIVEYYILYWVACAFWCVYYDLSCSVSKSTFLQNTVIISAFLIVYISKLFLFFLWNTFYR